jgi:hypothetical protein
MSPSFRYTGKFSITVRSRSLAPGTRSMASARRAATSPFSPEPAIRVASARRSFNADSSSALGLVSPSPGKVVSVK